MAQGQRSHLCHRDGSKIHQRRNSNDLSQPRLLGRRCTWVRSGGAALFWPFRGRCYTARGGDVGGPFGGAHTVCAHKRSFALTRARACDHRFDGRTRLYQHHHSATCPRQPRRIIRSRRSQSRWIFRRLGDAVGARIFHQKHNRRCDHRNHA